MKILRLLWEIIFPFEIVPLNPLILIDTKFSPGILSPSPRASRPTSKSKHLHSAPPRPAPDNKGTPIRTQTS